MVQASIATALLGNVQRSAGFTRLAKGLPVSGAMWALINKECIQPWP